MPNTNEVREFMSGFLKARIEEGKREIQNRLAYREQFFEIGCMWDSRDGLLEMLESESVSDVVLKANNADVITEYKYSKSKLGHEVHKRLFHIVLHEDGWKIQCVEQMCPGCQGNDRECVVCHGKKWV